MDHQIQKDGIEAILSFKTGQITVLNYNLISRNYVTDFGVN